MYWALLCVSVVMVLARLAPAVQPLVMQLTL
jgi:hypothetical protein